MSAKAGNEARAQEQFLVAIVENVHCFTTPAQVATLDEDGAAEALVQDAGCPAHVLRRSDLCAQKNFRFWQIGHQERG